MNELLTLALYQQRQRATSVLRRLVAGVRHDLLARGEAFRLGRVPGRKSQHLVPELGVRNLETILAAAHHLGGPYGRLDRTLIEAAATSRRLRESELLALRWGDIDWIEGTVNVERALHEKTLVRPKCGRSRKMRLAPHTRLSLLRHRASLAVHGPEDLVFPDPTTGSFLDIRFLRRRLGAACRQAGFPAIAFRNLPMAFKAPWWSRYL